MRKISADIADCRMGKYISDGKKQLKQSGDSRKQQNSCAEQQFCRRTVFAKGSGLVMQLEDDLGVSHRREVKVG